jgi:hypothetical protein
MKMNRIISAENQHFSKGIAKPMLPAVPMWTMVAEHGFRYHFATDTFVSFCGRSNLYVRDYVEFIDGAVRKVGEGRQVFEQINEYATCKVCLAAVKRHSR